GAMEFGPPPSFTAKWRNPGGRRAADFFPFPELSTPDFLHLAYRASRQLRSALQFSQRAALSSLYSRHGARARAGNQGRLGYGRGSAGSRHVRPGLVAPLDAHFDIPRLCLELALVSICQLLAAKTR